MPAWLDAVEAATNMPLQIELSDEAAAREKERGLFSVTDEPRGIVVWLRAAPGWLPVKVAK